MDGKVPFVPVGHWFLVPRPIPRPIQASLIEDVPLSSPSVTYPLHVANPSNVVEGSSSSGYQALSAFTGNFNHDAMTCKLNE